MVKKAKARPKKAANTATGRTRKLNKKQQKAKAKKEAGKQVPITGSFRLVGQAYDIFKNFWKPLAGIVVVYLILNVIFASGLGNLNATVDNIKANISGKSIHLSDALHGFGSLIGASGSGGSQGGSALQSVLVILESLVIIWALRQLLAGKKITAKQAYYSAMTPLVPFSLVILVIILQLLPIILGAAALAVVVSSVSVGFVIFLFSIIFALLTAWSLYMVSGSIFALYIVTLPDMQPRPALRSAKNLVRYRRWSIFRRLLFLPLFILVAMGVITVPLILIATWLVAPIFYLLSMLVILFVHSYLYSLYRSLLG